MDSSIQVGAILMKDWPMMTKLLELKSEPCSGNWNLVKALSGLDLDQKIRAAGWNFFFMAAEVRVMFLGTVGAKSIQSALERILGKVKQQHFNALEVTGIVARHFIGVPYVTVSAHSRHLQHSCYLDGDEARRTSQSDGDWVRD